MTWAELKAVLADMDYDDRDKTRAGCLVEALQLCMSIDPRCDVAAEHDIIYFGPSYLGDGDDCPFTPEQAKRLAQLGVHVDTDTDSLAIFT